MRIAAPAPLVVLALLLAISPAGPVMSRDAGRAGEGPPARVEAVVLGVVQDGGLPHLGCRKPCCEAARGDATRAGKVASLAIRIATPAGVRVYLLDATPDFRAQVDLALSPAEQAGRAPGKPVDGIFLTHAHVGHYTGLAYLGRESIGALGVPVWATPRMGAFLRENGPWRRLVSLGNIDLREAAPGSAVPLGDGVSVEAIRVAHREEDSDAVGFLVTGPGRRLLYLPDVDAWSAWERQSGVDVARLVEGVDIALLDGTFHSAADLGTRSIAEIPHPMMTDTMDRLSRLAASRRILFIHLNHSNPALPPGSAERRAIEARGFAVAAEGLRLSL